MTEEQNNGSYAALPDGEVLLATPEDANNHMIVADEENVVAIHSDHTWTDTYFDDKVSAEDLVAVFDVNYVALKRKFYCLTVFFVAYFVFIWLLLVFQPFAGSLIYFQATFTLYFGFILFLVGSSINRQVKNVHGLHVAVTRQGVRKDSNRFPSAGVFNNSTMMPYNEISKVFVCRPWCGACGESLVYIVAAADQTSHPIQGLKDPDEFVALVKRMMEQNMPAVSTADPAWVLSDSKIDEADLTT